MERRRNSFNFAKAQYVKICRLVCTRRVAAVCGFCLASTSSPRRVCFPPLVVVVARYLGAYKLFLRCAEWQSTAAIWLNKCLWYTIIYLLAHGPVMLKVPWSRCWLTCWPRRRIVENYSAMMNLICQPHITLRRGNLICICIN